MCKSIKCYLVHYKSFVFLKVFVSAAQLSQNLSWFVVMYVCLLYSDKNPFRFYNKERKKD